MKNPYYRKLTAATLTLLATALCTRAQQATESPLVVQKTLTPSQFGLPNSPIPNLKLELRVGNPAVVEGDLTIGLFDGGSYQQGIFQLNNNGSFGTWNWQNSVNGATPHVNMELTNDGRLRLFGAGNDSIVLRATNDGIQDSNGHGPAGVFVNGSRLVSESWLANGLIPEIQAVTLQVGSALSLGDVNGIVGTGSMAAGLRASVYGSGSLAFGTDAHVGTPLNINGQPSGSVIIANNAVALGKNANARGDGAMAFGTNANAAMKQSIAIGEDATASGGSSIYYDYNYTWGSVAVGSRSSATGTVSSAFGIWSSAMGNESIALGARAATWPGATASIAMGWTANAWRSGGLAIGNGSNAKEIGAVCLGSITFAEGPSSVAIGAFNEATGAGMVSVGVAPNFSGLTSTTNWADLNSVVFIVGGGQQGAYNGAATGRLDSFDVIRRTSLSVTRGGDVKAGGKLEASKAGGLLVPDTVDAKNGVTQLTGVVLIERQGDIGMGAFTDSPVVPH